MALNKSENDLVPFHACLMYVKLHVLKFSNIAYVSWKNGFLDLDFWNGNKYQEEEN